MIKRKSIETMAYIIQSHKPWAHCELVADDNRIADILTPSEAKCVTEVDRIIWNMVFGILS